MLTDFDSGSIFGQLTRLKKFKSSGAAPAANHNFFCIKMLFKEKRPGKEMGFSLGSAFATHEPGKSRNSYAERSGEFRKRPRI